MRLSSLRYWFLLAFACWQVNAGWAQPAPAATDPPHLAIARSLIGVTEAKRDCNCGAWVERFQHSVGRGRGTQWCAAYVSFCLDSAGVATPTVRSGLARHFKVRGHIPAKDVYLGRVKVHPGYLVGWERGTTITGHIGFVDSWSTRSGTTIEGNTSNPVSGKPEGVFGKTRTIVPGAYFRITWFTPVTYANGAYAGTTR